MNSDIGLQATSADIAIPKGSNTDLTKLRPASGDGPTSKEQKSMQLCGGDRAEVRREELGKEEGKGARKGEWVWNLDFGLWSR